MTIYVGISFPWMSSWALVDMYAKCGNFDSAREIFDRMQEKNVISWTAHGKLLLYFL